MIDLFGRLDAAKPRAGPELELLRSHPLTAARLEALRTLAARAGWPLKGPHLALPATLAASRR